MWISESPRKPDAAAATETERAEQKHRRNSDQPIHGLKHSISTSPISVLGESAWPASPVPARILAHSMRLNP